MNYSNPSYYDDGKLAAIRNPEGIFINVKPFQESASKFTSDGYYIEAPENTADWFDYWTEEKKRCRYGYRVGGVKITGDHYFYMNYTNIRLVNQISGNNTAEKELTFPHFWDGDFNFFWARNIARYGILSVLDDDDPDKLRISLLTEAEKLIEFKRLFDSMHFQFKIEPKYLGGGYNMIVGKSRRKGYSYKFGGISTNVYFTRIKSLVILNAYDSRFLYPRGLFSMARANINFVNLNTAWTMPSDYVDQKSHIEASFTSYVGGIKTKGGYESEIVAYTAKDNEDVNRGNDANEIFIDEAGAFGTPGLLKGLYKASEDCVSAGSVKTGMITIAGTSGDMEGGTQDYAEMHLNPLKYGMLPFNNIWDDKMDKQKCGFFHPITVNMEGHYDENGNSNIKTALKEVQRTRQVYLDAGASEEEMMEKNQERPLSPLEAFTTTRVSFFPIMKFSQRRNKVLADSLHIRTGTPIELFYDPEKKKVTAKVVFGKDAAPKYRLSDSSSKRPGVLIVYESPDPMAPPGTYKIGYDPIRHDQGSSDAAIVVIKTTYKGATVKHIIAAEFTGRLGGTDDVDFLSMKLAIWYSTQVMYENEVPGTAKYYKARKMLHLLCVQPDVTIKKNVKNSKVNRIYGCHVNMPLKLAGIRYINTWLKIVINYDEEGNPITVLDLINSLRFLDEGILFHLKGNFDLISAMIMAIMQIEEEYNTTATKTTAKENNKMILNLIKRMNNG